MRNMFEDLKLIILAIGVFFLQACTFDAGPPPGGIIPSVAKLVTPTSDNGEEVLKEKLYVYHGSQCAESLKGDGVLVERKFDLPTSSYTYVDAFVVLNGWRFKFLHDDTQIAGLGVSIEKKEFSGNSVNWTAFGVIGDEDYEEAYEFCYQYTLLAMTEDFKETIYSYENLGPKKWTNPGNHTAVMSVPRHMQNSAFKDRDNVEILPRGFGVAWNDRDDDYFLQFAYHLGHSERYIYGPHKGNNQSFYQPEPTLPQYPSSTTTDFANRDYTSWESSVIFKNGDSPDAFILKESVLGLGSNEFSMIDPHFSIQPIQQRNGTFKNDPESEEVVVKNVPYQFAVPVLKGWDLRFEYDDEDVREIGIWVESFDFERGDYLAGLPTGTLTYKVRYVLKDDDGNESYRQFGVSILGTNNIWPD